LASESTCEISTLTLLEENNPDQDETNNYVNGTDEPNHEKTEPRIYGAEGGT
jgi:hypothetical protein